MKAKRAKRAMAAMLCAVTFIAGSGTVANAAGSTAGFNFTVKTTSATGTASSEYAIKATGNDYAYFNVTGLSNTSYGVWLRADLGTYASHTAASSEQKFKAAGSKKSNYFPGMKQTGSNYVPVGRLVDGSPNVTTAGSMTP